MSTLSDVTLYDLMSQDLDVWISKHKEFGFNLCIDNGACDVLIDAHEGRIHPYAAESFAVFCRNYLYAYERVMGKEEV